MVIDREKVQVYVCVCIYTDQFVLLYAFYILNWWSKKKRT